MLKVERFAVDHAAAQKKVDFTRSHMMDLIGKVSTVRPALSGVFDASHQLAAAASVVAPDDPMLQSAIQINAQAAAAMFTLSNQKVQGKPVSYSGPLGSSTVEISGFVPNSSLGPTNYQVGLFSSLISRDHDANHRLCVIPPPSLRQGGVQADEYQYAWNAMLGQISRGESLDGAVDAITAETTPDRVTIASRNDVDETLWLARAAAAARAGDAAAVNEGLAKSLEAFRKIWETDPKRWRGWLSLGAAAIACWAVDQGISITVESEYMPRSLLRA